MLAIGLAVYLFCFLKKYRAKKETEKQKLIEACKQTDINKMVWLLEKGIDPNTIVQVWVDEYWSNPPEYCDCSHYENRTLLDITHSPAAKKLLRAYGAKTIKEIMEEEAAIEKARFAAKKAERMRQEAILQAEKKAKEEEDLRKVDAFLASKKS